MKLNSDKFKAKGKTSNMWSCMIHPVASLQSLCYPCDHSDTRVVFKPANGNPSPAQGKIEKIKTSNRIPQAISQYRVNAATMASTAMEGLIDDLPAMFCVVPVLDGDGADEDGSGPV